jgi:flavin-dependent dehydrogenase
MSRGTSRRESCYFSHVYGAVFSEVDNPAEPLCCYLLPSRELGSGGGWYYSIGRSGASFGYAQITDSPQSDVKALKAIFYKARRDFEPYSGYLQRAKIEHIETGVIPISYADKLNYGSTLIIGDAAGMATNWTCMGIEPALKYGRLAGELTAQAIMENNLATLGHFQGQWERENKSAFDLMKQQAPMFWNSDYYFWEWIVKNDLAFLKPHQVIDRLRYNAHLLSRKQALFRVLRYKARGLLNRKNLEPRVYQLRD